MFNAIQPWHLVVLVIILLVLFGSKRLPDAARGLGRSLRIFKSEIKEMQNDDSDASATPKDPEPQRKLPSGGSTETAASTDDVKKTA